MARAAVAISIALAALELSHPTWTDGSVAQAVQAAGGWWVPLHLLLIAGYGGLAVVLWRELPRGPARLLPPFFAVCSTAYLAVDGIAVGLLAQTDPASAEAVWTAPAVGVLANVTGAAWAAALLASALSIDPTAARGRFAAAGAALTWLAFVASALPVPAALAASRVAALATGAWAVYQHGARSMSFALLVFGAVLRQHAGPEAALGVVCVALAFALKRR